MRSLVSGSRICSLQGLAWTLDDQHVHESNSFGPKGLGIRSMSILLPPSPEKKKKKKALLLPYHWTSQQMANPCLWVFRLKFLEASRTPLLLFPTSNLSTKPVDTTFSPDLIASPPLPRLPCWTKTAFHYLPLNSPSPS